MASSAKIEPKRVKVDEWDSVLFDDGEGGSQEYMDITFE